MGLLMPCSRTTGLFSKKEEKNNTKIIRPGFLVNIFIGGIAALVSWGLYGPFAEAFIIGGTVEPDAHYHPQIKKC